jgi:ribosome biogenesis GTPase / thiamine phosphate phosphatase
MAVSGFDQLSLASGDRHWGLVLATQANYYRVRLDSPTLPSDGTTGSTILCTRRARLKKTGQRVMVGDRVGVEALDWVDGRGAIAEVLPRQTVLDRPPVANADQILLVFALAEPDLDPQQMGRFLVTAEATGIPVHLCLTKQDLISDRDRHQWQEQIHQWGYAATTISLHQGEAALAPLRQILEGHTTVVFGPSGVGKSSLINRLIPQVDLRTGAVSGKLGRGRHTTRHVELFALPEGGYLADTPGFNQPDLALTPLELGPCFPEIRQRLDPATCQFKDCLHRGDAGCGVDPHWPRYELYLALLEEAIAYQESLQRQRDPDAAHKVRIGAKGERHQEPRLQTKQYRRPSRRRQKQDLNYLQTAIEDPEDPPEGHHNA